MIPDREECLRLMERHGMLENIIAHSLQVTKVALFLSMELNQKGQTIDLRLVEAGSLLHDIAKTVCIKTKEDHTQAGCRLLKEIGYERVGEIVAQHVWLKKEGDFAFVSEEEVVNYADKRVRHDQIVTLEERFLDLKNRYGRDQKSIDYLDRLEKIIYGIENKIFFILKIRPDDLQSLTDAKVHEAFTSGLPWSAK
ncbi:MAG TPA: HDIG domain-containing protein [Thermodesulfobacteriota bacterium]|nr:HDIG domain-containing protein [Thermodesulfobacteriota bacterium]